MKKVLLVTAAGAVLSLASLSATAGQVYLKGGLLGAGVGYAHGVNSQFTLRGDVTTIGNLSHNGTVSGFDYKGKVKNNTLNFYGDWFPFDNGFRLTAGLNVRDTNARADGRANQSGQVTIGDTPINYGPEDHASAKIKLPTVTPYLGLGWGHNVAQQKAESWGFIADAGVSFGRPKVSFSVSDATRAKLDAATGGHASREIAKQEDEINDKVKKYRLFPHIYVGVSYAF